MQCELPKRAQSGCWCEPTQLQVDAAGPAVPSRFPPVQIDCKIPRNEDYQCGWKGFGEVWAHASRKDEVSASISSARTPNVVGCSRGSHSFIHRKSALEELGKIKMMGETLAPKTKDPFPSRTSSWRASTHTKRPRWSAAFALPQNCSGILSRPARCVTPLVSFFPWK